MFRQGLWETGPKGEVVEDAVCVTPVAVTHCTCQGGRAWGPREAFPGSAQLLLSVDCDKWHVFLPGRLALLQCTGWPEK